MNKSDNAKTYKARDVSELINDSAKKMIANQRKSLLEKRVTEKIIKLASLIPKSDQNENEFGENLKESSKQKEKGRISLPEQQNLADASKNENLLRMPFSLNEIDNEEINSPFYKIYSNVNDPSNSNTHSIEIQMENDDDLFEVDERNLFEDFDMSDIEVKKSEKQNKSNHMIESSNLYLNLSNKLVPWKDDIYQINDDGKHVKKSNKSYNYPHTTEKTGHQTGPITNTASNKKKTSNMNVFKSDYDQDLSLKSSHKVKSFTTRKRIMYSEFDENSEHESGATDLLQVRRIEKNKIKSRRPCVIKGFWSSLSSQDSQSANSESHVEKEVVVKPDFYNSGLEFNRDTDSDKKVDGMHETAQLIETNEMRS